MIATTTGFCEPLVAPDSIYGLLHRECHRLFPDEMFADLFCDVGRRSVPPMIVAVVMVLQRLEGCSDREAVERFCFDARWKYAAGGLRFDYPAFVHTVLVDMRARLAASEDPERIFNVTLDVGKRAGLVGRRRVLDSTPIYDAVATMDTVTLVRSAIRGLLGVCELALAGELRGLLGREDDYRSAGKPMCDYEDREAREALVDALAKDARALLAWLDGRAVSEEVRAAGVLLASVVGQDLDEGQDGVFRIARRVAKDRIISTVDPDARHGRKTSARGFDGYKGHVAIDPDSELIIATTVSAGNAGDAAAASGLLTDDLPKQAEGEQAEGEQAEDEQAEDEQAEQAEDEQAEDEQAEDEQAEQAEQAEHGRLSVYGDAAYGSGELLDTLERSDAEINCKVQPPHAPGGRFSKATFAVDLDTGTVSCPAGHTVTLTPVKHGQLARFAGLCTSCPLAAQCTTSHSGRTIHIGRYERQLARARERQSDPAWTQNYKQTRPKVERKIAHLTRASTADDAPACAAHPKSPLTSHSSPPPSTSPASASSDSHTTTKRGQSTPARERATRHGAPLRNATNSPIHPSPVQRTQPA